mmetsp:Transcript_25439/g.63812  ORF Transcript_25439/g.63812 Transcript_25439/m.63812 type:complete len:206 (-) Transcript_25439:2310-2927(-)
MHARARVCFPPPRCSEAAPGQSLRVERAGLIRPPPRLPKRWFPKCHVSCARTNRSFLSKNRDSGHTRLEKTICKHVAQETNKFTLVHNPPPHTHTHTYTHTPRSLTRLLSLQHTHTHTCEHTHAYSGAPMRAMACVPTRELFCNLLVVVPNSACTQTTTITLPIILGEQGRRTFLFLRETVLYLRVCVRACSHCVGHFLKTSTCY